MRIKLQWINDCSYSCDYRGTELASYWGIQLESGECSFREYSMARAPYLYSCWFIRSYDARAMPVQAVQKWRMRCI